jgi:hypothetical protein
VPSYETLDAIADAYNPLLALVSLLLIAARVFKAKWKLAGVGMAGFMTVALVAYGLMFLDRHLGIWPAFGLDYSTHTATALGLVILLSIEARRLATLWSISFICYVLLMLYQRYHTVADVVTTAVAVSFPHRSGHINIDSPNACP